MSFGKNLQYLRQLSANMTQETLAEKLNELAHEGALLLYLDGKPEIPAKVRGTRKGIDFCCKMITETPPDPEFPVTVMYTYDRSNGEKLAEALRKLSHVIPEDRIVPVGAVVGSHIGPNACAIVYIAKEN